MKKLISILTALLLIFSLTTVAYGAGSPQGKKEFGVSVKGNIGTWSDVLHSVEEGKTYDLSAPDMDGYDFVGWVIDGEYDIVSGDVNSKNLTILPKSDIEATAMYTAKVDLKDDEVKVEYTHNIEGLEENYEIVKKGKEVELSAMEDLPGYEFIKWEIYGNYEIVSGSLNSSELVIIPLGNIIVKQIFEEVPADEDIEDEEEPEENEEDEEEDKDDGKKPPKGDTNDSEESPQTGMALPIVGLIAALGAAVVSKKLSK